LSIHGAPPAYSGVVQVEDKRRGWLLRNGGELAALVILTGALTYQLLIPPCLGLADNGDYKRNMSPFGITKSYLPYDDSYWNWFVPHYEMHSASRHWFGLASTEMAFIVPAVALNSLLSSRPGFDLRCVGAVHIVLLLAAVWLILVALKAFRWPVRMVFAIGLATILSDVGYASYLNSFYSEPATLLSLLAMVGFLALIAARPEPTSFALLGLLGSVLAFLFAKPQNAIAGPILVVLLLRITILRPQPRWKRTCIAAALAAGIATAAVFSLSPEWLRRNSLYIAVFTELLPASKTPLDDLMQLGLDPSLARFSGTHPWTSNTPINRPDFQAQFFSRVSYWRLAEFYLHHPGRYVRLLNEASSMGLAIRPPDLGNFTKSAGRPAGTQSTKFGLWSRLHWSVLPHRANSLLGLFLLLAAYPWIYYRGADRQVRLLLEFQSGLALIATTAFLAIVFVQGTMEVTRVMFPVDVLLDLTMLAAVAEGAAALSQSWAKRRAHPSPVQPR
jgi:hypothetical protein